MDELQELVHQWERQARRKFADAARENDPIGKRLIEHGAMCYFNCSQDLKEALSELSPPSSATPLAGQRRTKRKV